MIAKFVYGRFTMEMEVGKNPSQIFVLPKPPALPDMAEQFDPTRVEKSNLEFIAKRSPRVGEQLVYEFVGER